MLGSINLSDVEAQSGQNNQYVRRYDDEPSFKQSQVSQTLLMNPALVGHNRYLGSNKRLLTT